MLKTALIIYWSLCIGYGLFSILKKHENGLIKTIIATFLPGLGLVLTIYLFKKEQSPARAFDVTGTEEDKESGVFSETIRPIDIESEINLVPLQEALILNDNKTKRKLLIHSLKENSVQNPEVLKKALQNEDTETSHYAATSIMETKRKLQNSCQELAMKLKKSPGDIALQSAYANAIKYYLDSGFLDEGTYQQYQSLFSEALEKVLDNGKGSKEQFIDKINIDLELKDYNSASYYSERFLTEYFFDEAAYLTAMKLQYALHDKTGLQEIISRLKKQPIHLSGKTLEIIRYWN